MTKRLFEIECMGQPVTVEVIDPGGGFILHGYDPDAEEALWALGHNKESMCAKLGKLRTQIDLDVLLFDLVEGNYRTELVELALALGADPDFKPFSSLNVLGKAINAQANTDDLGNVAALLKHGARVEKGHINGTAAHGDVELMQLLIEHGGDTYADRHEAIFMAVRHLRPEMVGFLLEQGLEPWRHGVEILSAPMNNSERRHLAHEIVAMLLEHGQFTKKSIATGYERAVDAGDEMTQAVFEDYICSRYLDEEE